MFQAFQERTLKSRFGPGANQVVGLPQADLRVAELRKPQPQTLGVLHEEPAQVVNLGRPKLSIQQETIQVVINIAFSKEQFWPKLLLRILMFLYLSSK